MTNHRTDVSTALALLERADPVDPQQLAAELDMTLARERVARLIAAEPAAARAPRHLPAQTGLKAMVAALAVAATVAVIAIALDSGTPAVQTASAKTITRALRALTAPTGSILHIDATTIEIDRGHPTIRWEQEIYEQTVLPFRARIIDKRLPGTVPGTEAVFGVRIGEPIYDPIRNTIYDPRTPKPKPVPGARTLSPAQEARLFEPYMAQYVRRLRAKLGSGAAHVAGRAIVDGREAIKITFRHSDEIDYVAADGTYVPVETIQGTPASPGGQLINVYHTFEHLTAAGHMGLLDLKTQHPSALIDRSLADFRAAINRLYPNG